MARWRLTSQNFPLAPIKKLIATAPVLTLSSSKGWAFQCFGEKENSPNAMIGRTAAFLTPPAMMWHQHFNTGAAGARYLPPRLGGIKYSLGESFGDITTRKLDKERQGGWQPDRILRRGSQHQKDV